MNALTDWKFMGETPVEWFIFLGLLIISLIAWRKILGYM